MTRKNTQLIEISQYGWECSKPHHTVSQQHGSRLKGSSHAGYFNTLIHPVVTKDKKGSHLGVIRFLHSG